MGARGLLALTVLAPVMLAMYTGCTYHRDKNGMASGPSADSLSFAPSDKLTIPSYALVREQVFAPRCIECHQASHGNPGGVNLETYDSTKQNVSKIAQAVLVDRTMPKGGSISASEANLLAAWIQAGAPEQGHEEPANPTSDVPTDYRWSNVNQKVIQVSCIQCHHNDAQDDIKPSFTSLEKVRSHADDILDQVFVEGTMPPAKMQPLTQEQRTILLEWIRYGMGE